MKLQIGTSEWSIEIVPDLCTDEGDELFGITETLTKTIQLRAGMQPLNELAVLFHELTHAIAFEYGLSNVIKHKHEELLADVLGTALACALQKPELRQYIASRTGG